MRPAKTLHDLTIRQLVKFRILKTLGLEHLSKKEKKDFLDYAAGLVLDRVVARIVKKLPEDKKSGFFQLFKPQTSDEEKAVFLRNHVPNLEVLFWEEFLLFKNKATQIAQTMDGQAKPPHGSHDSPPSLQWPGPGWMVLHIPCLRVRAIWENHRGFVLFIIGVLVLLTLLFYSSALPF